MVDNKGIRITSTIMIRKCESLKLVPFDPDPANASRLFSCLQEFWAGDIPSVASADELSEPGLIVQFGRPPNRLDLMNAIDGVDFEEAWRSKESATNGTNLRRI
jgi:hypothetical protein